MPTAPTRLLCATASGASHWLRARAAGIPVAGGSDEYRSRLVLKIILWIVVAIFIIGLLVVMGTGALIF